MVSPAEGVGVNRMAEVPVPRMRNRYSTLVVVEASLQDSTAVVEVRDDGPGIPVEDRTKVLEPFVRVDSAPTRAHRGLGLGLAIVQKIVEQHNGKSPIG